jgi:hypothetical protein
MQDHFVDPPHGQQESKICRAGFSSLQSSDPQGADALRLKQID